MSSILDTDRKRNYLADTSSNQTAFGRALSGSDTVLPVFTEHSGLKLVWQSGQPVASDPLARKPIQAGLKRALDITVGGMALIGLLPLFLLIAVAIKFNSPGPVFFVQQREGLNGKMFGVLKFRTMRAEDADQSGVLQTSVGDRRVTRVGQFLRRTSVDELPQLINVLRGEMSLVGPRPHVPGMLANGVPYGKLVPYYALRHQIKPGITGWAQANGLRGETVSAHLASQRIEHDIAYIQNFSIVLDVVILVMTIRREFLTGNGV